MTGDREWSSAGDPNRRLGRTVEYHARIGSTNDRALERLRQGDAGSAIVADLQTAGRGRHGRTWTSPAGVNLMVSVGFRPVLEATDAWLLSAATALALREACRSVLSDGERDGVGLKWPNDIVDAHGRKLAGLLIETAIAGERVTEAVIGVGLNVNWRRADMPAELADRSISLIELAGSPVDRVAVLRSYLSALAAEVAAVEAGVTPVERYRAASWLTGREVSISTGERITTGLATGIADDGSLELRTDGALRRIGHGEVVQVGVRGAAGVPA